MKRSIFDKEVLMKASPKRYSAWIWASVGLAALQLAGCGSTMTRTTGIIAEGAQWQEVSRAGILFAEGVVADKSGIIYATDLTRTFAVKENNPGGTIYRYDPATGATTKLMEPSGMANGLHVDKNGDLLVAQGDDTGGRAVLRRNLATGATRMLVNSYRGKRLNGPNDLTSDAQGRIYFTDARYAPGKEAFELPNSVYRLDTDGSLTELQTGLFRPNGIEVSPDGKRLYVATTNYTHLPINPLGPKTDRFGLVAGGVVVFDLDAGGSIANGRLLFRDDQLAADGMTLDTDGNLYIATHNANPKDPKSGIVVIDPEGKIIERITNPPGALSTNVGFGRGSEANVLYMSSALPWRLYRIRTTRNGHYFN